MTQYRSICLNSNTGMNTGQLLQTVIVLWHNVCQLV